MTQFDDRIADALDADDRAFLDSLDQKRGMFTQMGDVLSGPLGGWAKLMFIVSLILGIALIFAGWQFFTATSQTGMIRWGLVTLALLMFQGFTKEWFFARMNMLTILREVKRAELRLSMHREA